MHTDRRFTRPAASAAILGLALTTGVFAAPASLDLAPAAVAVEPPSASDQAATIDFDKPGSITIHKRAGEKTDNGADGNELADPPGTPLNGVEYKITLIRAYDSAEDVVAGQQLTLEKALAQKEGKQPRTGTTEGDGVVSFEGLKVGRYLVEEISAPAGHVPGGPFLVSVPMTNPATQSGWNYDVQVYPKNTENKAEKAVVDAGKHTGDEITYTITSDIPTPATGGLAKYEIVDDYDENMVEIDPAKITAALDNGTALTPGEDFTAAESGGTVTVTFTEAGLKKLSKGHEARVVTTIPATVKEIPEGAESNVGEGLGGVAVTNTATVTSNEGSGGPDGSTDTNEVQTIFGKLRVEKVGEGDKPLNGAVFELYNCSTKDDLGDRISVAGENTWTTVDGQATINALHITDFADDKEGDSGKYCLVEVEAPAGYELLAEPVEVDFSRTALGEEGGDGVTLTKKITNVESTAPSLPLTGGMGIGIIAALGALIIGAGVWLAKRNGTKA
ncbi:hypothetical protein CSPHI_00675 [Corynebacterium sphenisci DSM 44792]|uniref:Gram-positive pilin subunit D1 N-terminal domain-containing protein n=1 Tax=Corynebacterium sphenisci DSM 44792 TaxID=1437874 RepID=A0A1L7CVM1_9CORY|nr:SpaH/EbpB family LPXTG-anchored major pilin [Corynebacterium sphenisci]APT89851.1 hypothetical protein CSPHI_00675 [Corynebacterium sphenisci DSM 44792]